MENEFKKKNDDILLRIFQLQSKILKNRDLSIVPKKKPTSPKKEEKKEEIMSPAKLRSSFNQRV